MSQAVQTDGIGNKTTKHLNLTQTLVDTWKAMPPDQAMIRARARAAARMAAKRYRVPYSGIEREGAEL